MEQSDIGLIGLAVMGENLVMNMESRGFAVSVYNRTPEKVKSFLAGRAGGGNIRGAYSLEELVGQLAKPRKVMLMVKAGRPVDDFIELLLPLLEAGDIIIDGGNSHFPDTIRRTRYQAAYQAVDRMIEFLRIICNTRNHLVSALSGGNQQKVVMGKWLSTSPKVLLMDQPTRGVDVGAKSEIYELIQRLVEQGTSIVLITDEIEEILNLSDRILIMRKGRITKEFDNSGRDRMKSEILEAMVG